MNKPLMTKVQAQDRPRRHFIANARLLDGRSAPTDKPHSILIEDTRIAAVGPSNELTCPQGVDAVDAQGLTLMPGMIDCHDHLASIPGSMRDRSQIPPSLAVIRAYVVAIVSYLPTCTTVATRPPGSSDGSTRPATCIGRATGKPISATRCPSDQSR